MARIETLNSELHRDLRLRRPAAPWPHFVQVVASEFASAAACCPILLTKNPETGRFFAGAMSGFRAGENLLAEEPGASRAFRPLEVERQGFFISGENIAIDVEHPRISRTEGAPLFDEDGAPGERLQRIQRALGSLKAGIEETDRFISALVDLRLVEPIDVSLRFDDGETLRLEGLYTVSLDSIRDLDDATALSLFRKSYLQLAYCMAGSLRQIPVLAHRRNQRLAQGD